MRRGRVNRRDFHLKANDKETFMKKIISIFIIALVLGISSAAMAEKPSVTIGLKTWIATWERKGEIIVDEDTDETLKFSDKSDYGLMYGPVINLRYEKLFASLSYMMGGDLNFERDQVDNYFNDYFNDLDLGPDYGINYDVNSKDDRTDFDIAIGYYVHPNISIFLGYKNVDIEEKIKVAWDVEPFSDAYYDDIKPGEIPFKESGTIKGPAFGVSGNYPIGETNWILLGSLSYLSLDGKWEGESHGDFTGPSLEIGGAYIFDNVPVSITAGYKYQSLESDKGKDIFSGLTFGVNYTL